MVIENQDIIYNIYNFPAINGEASNEGYSANVQTKYTLLNPTNKEITVRVSVPIDYVPAYYGIEDNYELSKYSISLNGHQIDPELRHAVDYDDQYRNLSNFGALVSDEYLSNEFCSPDTTVTKYTFKQSDVEKSQSYMGFDINDSELHGSLLYIKGGYSTHLKNGNDRIYVIAGENGCTRELYVFGKDLTHLPEWTVYKDVGVDDGDEVAGKIEYVSKETMTFNDFAFMHYDESLGINEVDWFNMAANEVSFFFNRDFLATLYGMNTAFISYRVSGFIYEITLAPGERVVNTINVPIYPSIETEYNPYTYQYSYILFQGNAEMFTGKINVNINTPYYLIDGDGFEKTDGGYSMTMDAMETLSDGSSVIYDRFEFTLCESENPEEIGKDGLTILAILLLPIILVITVVNAISTGINKLKQRVADAFKK